MEFGILGSIEATHRGQAMELGGLRERALLARLLLSANRVVSADRLAEDLWSGSPPPHSMATLRVYISRLRRSLGQHAGALVTHAPGYRLMVADDQLDAARFESMVRAADADLAAGRPAEAAEVLRAALGLWRGQALSDVADLAFAQADAGRLEESRLTALERRVEADLACGRHASLGAELDGLGTQHPLRERLAGLRIIALYRCGRQAGALSAYGELRERLAAELGIDPTPALRRLHEQVLRQDPALDWHPLPSARHSPAEVAGPGGPGPVPGDPGPVAAGQSGAGGQADPGMDGSPGRGESARRPAGSRPASGAGGAPGRGDGAGVTALASGPARGAASQPGRGAGGRATSLPAETTSFVGRAAELTTIEDLLGLSRLVTLTGPGGSGKSRLALRAGRLAADRQPGGIWLVELAPVSHPELVVPAVAAALAVREEPGGGLLDAITARLADAAALLIVDNCEHLIDAAAGLIDALLSSCPRLRVLATSQTRLQLPGEATWPVPPLTVPGPAEADPEQIAAAESVRLFCDRAALARPGFELTTASAAAVSAICRRLDGIPLAIELAAARVSALTPAQLSARLDNRFTLLTAGSRAGLPRHRTLQAAIDWSHGLLSEPEQLCLGRLAVFAGGCTIDAAEAVVADPALPADSVFDAIAGLVDRSLLTTEERYGSMRYGMLESIHQYAQRRLAEAGELRALRRRHLRWLADFAGQADFEGPDQGAWMDLLGAERDNVSAALDHGAGGDAGDREQALRLAGALAAFWMVRGPAGLGRSLVDAALAAAGPSADPGLRARALDGAGRLASVQGDSPAQRGYQEQSLAIWRELGDASGLARCLCDLGAAATIRAEHQAAREMYHEALALARGTGDVRQMAYALSGLGSLSLHEGDLDQATEHYTASMTSFREIGDLRRSSLILGNLGVVATNQGDFALAAERLEQHLSNARLLGDRKLAGGALTNLGRIAERTGELDRAAGLHRQALELAAQAGDRRLMATVTTNLGLVAHKQGDYPAAAAFHLAGLDAAQAIGERRVIAETIAELSAAAAALGLHEQAAILTGAADRLLTSIGDQVQGLDPQRIAAALATSRAALGENKFEAARASGRAMAEAETISYATDSFAGIADGQKRADGAAL